MRILLLTRYHSLGASSRVRFYQYISRLEKHGFDIFMSPLLSEKYVSDLQEGRRAWGSVIAGYLRRMYLLLFKKKSWDLIWIEKEAFPWLPWWIESLFLPRHIPWVVDYDDAVYHFYETHKNFVIRHALRNKHRQLTNWATQVVVGNVVLADYFSSTTLAHRISIIPSVVDVDKYTKTMATDRNLFVPTIVWIGQRSTAIFLQPYITLLQELIESGSAKFVCIGFDLNKFNVPSEYVPWSEMTEAEVLHRCDIGFMPLADGAFERGKCGYKIIQYMAASLPVVASAVGVNVTLVKPTESGFLVENLEQTRRAFKILCNDPDLRTRMGERGRRAVEAEYCLNVTTPKLIQVLIKGVDIG
jgi:glycosyltransferase involved in cell wall biosynthesis